MFCKTNKEKQPRDRGKFKLCLILGTTNLRTEAGLDVTPTTPKQTVFQCVCILQTTFNFKAVNTNFLSQAVTTDPDMEISSNTFAYLTQQTSVASRVSVAKPQLEKR